MPYLKRINSLPLINHISYKYAQVSDIGPSWSSCYLAQNYFKLPRQTIRENSNLICLFRQDLKSLNHIYADHVGDDMTKEEFRKFCKNCWDNTQHGFIVIDLTSKKENGKYRYGFDNFFIPDLKNN